MINLDTQIKIQAFFDGELAESEARELAALIAKDQEAAALYAELKNTHGALRGAAQDLTLPETREFYWSKIRREIEKMEREQAHAAPVSLWHTLARWLKPVGAVAAVAAAALLILHPASSPTSKSPVVTAMAGADAMTYRDEVNGTTLVWFTYPVENGVANDGVATTLK